jgi:hypothetical protein
VCEEGSRLDLDGVGGKFVTIAEDGVWSRLELERTCGDHLADVGDQCTHSAQREDDVHSPEAEDERVEDVGHEVAGTDTAKRLYRGDQMLDVVKQPGDRQK